MNCSDQGPASVNASNRTRTFTGQHLAEIAFPIGGIGTGTISLGGRANLRDWEIYNHPAKGKNLPWTFFALRAQTAGKPPVTKILERELLPPFSGGHGPQYSLLPGMPRFAESRFTGEYPFAWVDLIDETMPVNATLEAFNPFVPLDVDASALPAVRTQLEIHQPHA